MPAVTFDVAKFRARYPEFTAVPTPQLQTYFDEAALLYLANADAPVANEAKRLLMFNMLVAHIGFLSGALAADGMARPVGRVSQAGEGSVSASFEDLTPGSGAWFQQSQYGAAFWRATNNLRGFRYIPQPTTYR